MALAATTLLTACAEAPTTPPSSRIVLFYDYSGAWAATAGDACDRQIGLSDGVFVSIQRDPAGDRNRFYPDGFFMIEPDVQAEALPGVVEADGALELAIESAARVGGQPAVITYRLRLAARDPYHIRVTSFQRTVRAVGASGESMTETVELLEDEELRETVPVLATAGAQGLCLRRL